MKKTLMVSLLLAVSGCGLATSDEERLQRAEEKISTGAYRSAMIELKNVLANDSQNIRARLMLAEISLGLADLETADKEMRRAAELGAPEAAIRPLHLRILAAKQQHTEVLAALGMDTSGLTEAEQLAFRGAALLGLNNAQAAEETYREWLALEPGSTDAAVGLAASLAAGGDRTTAIADLREIVAQHPQHVDALHTLGSLHARAGNYEEAEKLLGDALQNSVPQMDIGRHVLINGALVEAQLALGKTDDARNSLKRLASVVPQSPLTLYLAARLARLEQDYALAARHLQMLLNVSPDNRQAQLFLANVQMMQGNYAQAEVLLHRVVSLSPDNIQARKLLAQVQLRQSQPQGAVEALAPLLDGSGDDPDIYNLLAQISIQQGDAQSVIQNLRAAAESAPDDMGARLNLAAAYLDIGEVELGSEVLASVPESFDSGYRREALQLSVYRQQGQVDAANRYAQDLLDEHGEEPRVVLTLSSHFVDAGDTERARQVLSGFVASHPEHLNTTMALARLELANGNIPAARKLFAAAQAIDEQSLFAALGLARIAELDGDKETSFAMLEAAAAAHPAAIAPRIWLASRYLEAGRLQDAETTANEMTAIGYSNAQISEIVGRIFVEAGRLEDAAVQFGLAVKLDPESPSIRFNAARAYLAMDETVEARDSLNRALQIRPGWKPAKALLALVELRQGQADAALQHVAELAAAHPDDTSVMVLEGEIRLYQRDFEKAAAAFNRAVTAGAGRRAMLREFQARVNGQLPGAEKVLTRWLAREPDDLVSRSALAQYYLQTRNADDAIREFETILNAQPDNAVVLNNLAWQYQQVGQLDKALDKASRAFEIDRRSGAIADTLAWIYRDLGQLDKSLELLGDATRLAPDNGEIRFHLAQVLAETGNESEARRILRDLVGRDVQFPSRASAEKLLEQL